MKRLQKITLKTLLQHYPELSSMNIKVSWSNAKLGLLYIAGWKLCSNCNYMIKLAINRCRLCGSSLRTRTIKRSVVREKLFAEPIIHNDNFKDV